MDEVGWSSSGPDAWVPVSSRRRTLPAQPGGRVSRWSGEVTAGSHRLALGPSECRGTDDDSDALLGAYAVGG